MKMTYRTKLLLILLALVVVLQASSYIATRTVIRDAVLEDAYRKLEQGSRLFSQLMLTRAQQLSQSVSVLTDDYGFKQAVATADEATIRSVLINHSARINADIALVMDNQQHLVASSLPITDEQIATLNQIDLGGGENQVRYFPVIINDKLYQFVLSPIRAPLSIGTAGIGFEIDQDLSSDLQSLTALDVSFVAAQKSNSRYLSGTLSADERNLLLATQQSLLFKEDVWRTDERLNSSVAIASDPTQIIAVLQVPLATALKPFAVLETQLLSLALSFVIGATLIAYFLARNVTRPVQLLAAVARKIAGGQYGSRVPVNGGDEFAELATAFNSMQSAISVREKEIRYQAEHDALTDLENRSQVLPRLNLAISDAGGRSQSLAVMIADINKFTQINDTLGPDTGDLVLRNVGVNLERLVGDDGYTLRLGSDEFLLLKPLDRKEQAGAIAEEIEHLFDQGMNIASTDIKVELNVGYAIFPEQGIDAEHLLRRSNLALKKARQSHLAMVQYCDGWDEDHLRRLKLFSDFKTALLRSEISLYYQPKINVHNLTEPGAEALVRWIHPEFGFVNPEEFIEVIESAGQIALLTRWVIRTAVVQASQLKALGYKCRISVNLSALDLLEDDLPDFIDTLLAEHELPAKYLCLEITESAIMLEAERSLANLTRLHALGTLLSIDDYGTGYSSLSQLKQLPVGELKIDKSFVMELDNNEEDKEIVKSTIELGHTLGMKVTAEGVETEMTRDWLVENGCDILQGYFYSKPLPAKDFNHWLESYRKKFV